MVLSIPIFLKKNKKFAFVRTKVFLLNLDEKKGIIPSVDRVQNGLFTVVHGKET